MERPEDVLLSRQDGEALIERLHRDALTAQDRRVLEQVLRWYFWLLFALQEARFSLKRLRALLFGAKPKKRQGPPADQSSTSSNGAGVRREEVGPTHKATARRRLLERVALAMVAGGRRHTARRRM